MGREGKGGEGKDPTPQANLDGALGLGVRIQTPKPKFEPGWGAGRDQGGLEVLTGVEVKDRNGPGNVGPGLRGEVSRDSDASPEKYILPLDVGMLRS